MHQNHTGSGDNVGKDKIERQIHVTGNYVEYQVNHAAPVTIPRALTANPFQTAHFMGREADLEAIETKLFSENPILLLVNGQGGMGSYLSKKFHPIKQLRVLSFLLR